MVDGAVFSPVKSCNVFPLPLLKGKKDYTNKIKPAFWWGQGHRRTVILVLPCWLKDMGTNREIPTQRAPLFEDGLGEEEEVVLEETKKSRRKEQKEEEDVVKERKEKRWLQLSYSLSWVAAWKQGTRNKEQADGLSSAPSWACYATLPWTPPPIFLRCLPSPFRVFFFHFTCLSVSQS